jgi:biopolymer transport protein ExbB
MSDDSAQPPARDGDDARGARGLDRWLPARDVRRGASAWHRIAQAFYANRNAPAAARDAHLTRLGEEMIHAMQRRVGVLSLIAGTAPLVGLLGTVGGMMLSFQEIAATGGQADIGRLADGLWVAMITTFAGLSVAIPSYLAHGFLQGLVERRVSAMNNLLRLLEERHAHLREAISGVPR